MKLYSNDDIRFIDSQFFKICQYNETMWSRLQINVSIKHVKFSTNETFVEMFRDILFFVFESQKILFIKYDIFSRLHFVYNWIMILHFEYEQRVKYVRDVFLLKIRISFLIKFQSVANVNEFLFDFEKQFEHVIFLIFMWLYILSFKWVEILQSIDKKAIFQSNDNTKNDVFWNIILKQ